ncbi:oxygen-independent coproporphyrinogen-3 oxidase [Terracoccus luteus]|uniref:Heme chaperone HemW n=1 Tax=Terracoccus luteus TaxID=53356 RepID=A0A495XVX2_9MICO|nr:radical SAM family heme chaperone HemW [Terracoccus luteus]RKT77659.1 oxygen-independent coproporphyrinogen-3 oxidase [Terracoccus luteus]
MPPSALPDGEPAPASGELPPASLRALPDGELGVYVHVPFCSVRCGYCDFNTYTLTELGGPDARVGLDTYADAALLELDLAARVLGPDAPPVSTVFVGGGTPTMLRSADLVRVLDGIRERFGLTDDAEVTTEANPDSVSPESVAELARGGFTRVSLGMQSAVPHVLRTLERTHDPANVARALHAVRAAGMQVSLDLIYGTPGESLEDWRTSLETALALEPDHVSAYALVVEDGTKLAAQVRRGVVAAPDDDDEADKYELADDLLSAAGYGWYEVSNWARDEASRCRHNLAYWRGTSWWGVGPGAHSHVGGTRWWNAKHPVAWAGRLAAGESPAQAREVLTEDQRHDERVLLGSRLVEGLPLDELGGSGAGGSGAGGRGAIAGLIADGLVDGAAAVGRRRVVLTRRGRLLADTVVHRLLGGADESSGVPAAPATGDAPTDLSGDLTPHLTRYEERA